MPLKINSFIVFTMLTGGGGGGGVGKGVCDGVCSTPFSTLKGGPINGLYSGLDPSQFLKNHPLCVASHIKVMASPIFHITTF